MAETTNEHSWLNREFFRTAMRHGAGDPNLEVVDCDVYLGTNVGDHYISVVYRASVEAETTNGKKGYKLVVKCVPKNEVRKSFVYNMNLFLKEIEMYNVIFPEFLKLQKKRSGKELLSSVPRCYYTVLDKERDCLVLDDLAVNGYKMADRKKGLDYSHCRLVLNELAKFHASSYAMKCDDLSNFIEKMDCFKESTFTAKNCEIFPRYLREQIDKALSLVKSLPECQMIVEKVVPLNEKKNMFEKILVLFESEEPVSVLNHGDFWVNNMLFSYENREDCAIPTKTMLLDFQMARYASPALDLLYFIYTSTTKQLRDNHLEELLRTYYNTFVHTVEELGFTVEFSFDILKQEIQKKLLYGFATACTILPAVMTNPEDVPDYNSLTEEDLKNPDTEKFNSIYKSNELIIRLRDIICELDLKGSFDS